MDSATDPSIPPPPETGPVGPPPPYPPIGHDLRRRGDGRMVAGVAAGVADYLDVDPTIVRVAFVALSLFGALAVPLYLAGWVLIPEDGTDVSVAEELFARERAR
jgi:phage shock protein C